MSIAIEIILFRNLRSFGNFFIENNFFRNVNEFFYQVCHDLKRFFFLILIKYVMRCIFLVRYSLDFLLTRFSILFKPTILSIHRECMQWNSWEHAQSAMLIIIYFPSATAIASLSLIIASTLIYHLSFTCQVHNEILMFIFSYCGIFS